MVYFIHHRQQYHLKDTYLSGIFWFLMRQVLKQQRKVTFIVCINQILVLNTFSFLFVQTSSFINSISLSFDLSESWTLNFCSSILGFILFWSFCFFYYFRCSECWLPWISLVFHQGKSLKLLLKSRLRGTPCIRLSLHHEKDHACLNAICFHHYYFHTRNFKLK